MIYVLNDKRKPLVGDPVLSEAGREELLVLLCLHELKEATAASLSEASALDESEVRAALQFWRGAGAVRTRAKSEETQREPILTKEEKSPDSEKKIHAALRHEMKLAPMNSDFTAKIIEEHELSLFLDACQQTAGQIFGPHDLEIVVGLYHQLGLEPEYILTLIAYCFGMNKRSMSYVEKVAFSFVLDQGIDTPEKLNAHIEALDRLASAEGKLRSLFGLGERALSKKEKDAFLKWLNDFRYGMDMIEAAYDKTVNNTGKASVPYADKILSHWHTSGCKTLKDAEELDAREAANKPVSQKKKLETAIERERAENRTFDPETIFERALARSYGKKKTDPTK